MPELRLLRRALAAVVALVVVGAASGCVGIPGDGPVNQGLSLSAGSGGANFDFNPEGPELGASKESILKGFVAAFTSATGGYAVAKKFLAESFAAKWDPRASVQVRSGQPRLASVNDTTILYSFDTIATVDALGAYTESSQPSTLQFGFVKEGGQWRINAAPAGIVLSDQTFQRIFTQQTLYFLDSINEHLVPDLRWFPRGTAATGVATSLLAGPPTWLKGAAFSRFPEGTQLSDAGSIVTPEDGVATIDLSKEALAASARERQLMKVQLSESLRSVGNISSVRISVEGTPLQIDDLGASGPQADTKVDAQPLVLRKGEFGFYANGQVAALSLSRSVVALKARAATLSSDGASIAVLGAGGVSLLRKGAAQAAPIDARDGLIPPSLDENGYIWSVPSGQPNAITAFDPAGVAHPVMAALPGDSQIQSLEVSRDGARVVILLSTPTGPRLIVSAILREPDKQAPLSLKAPILDLPLGDGVAIDATWVDQLTVATLVSNGEGSNVEAFTIGGQRQSLDSLPSATATAIVGGNGQTGLRVLAGDSTIWAYQGSSWQNTGVKVDFIATQR
jgi:hypothetical protein